MSVVIALQVPYICSRTMLVLIYISGDLDTCTNFTGFGRWNEEAISQDGYVWLLSCFLSTLIYGGLYFLSNLCACFRFVLDSLNYFHLKEQCCRLE